MKPFYARHRLDIRPRQLVTALGSMFAIGRDRAAADLEHSWSADGAALACYSVRSGFHLLLTALDLPRGSEVLFSAVTHPDMPRLARHHGLVPVPLDLDPGTLAPSAAQLERAITHESRVLVVAHLFGGHVDLAPLAAVCDQRGVMLVEDCAQSYQGPPDSGDSRAAVSMFSFGILKTSTALGGAVLVVRDAALNHRMRTIHSRWPVQSRSAHLKRIAQTAAFVAMTRPRPYAVIARVMDEGFDRFVNSSVRAFPATSTAELVRRLKQRPCAPLLVFLKSRLESFDDGRLLARAASGDRLAAMLPSGLHVGGQAPHHTHWLFPIAAADAEQRINAARAAGFDVARSASSVSAIAAPDSRPEMDPVCAREVMSRLVFVPTYPELPAGSLERLSALLAARETHAYLAL